MIHALDIDQGHIIYLDDEKKESMTVTVLDANHCPGAVMFIFEGYFGKIFYTGDFRYVPSILDTIDASIFAGVDHLYLDNTFCHPSCQFPPRSEAEAQIMRIISENLDKKIIFGVRNLGKECLLVLIGQRFRLNVGITGNQYEIIKILDLDPEIFTLDLEDARIITKPLMKISQKFMESHADSVAILPTALYSNLNVFDNVPNIFVVPYSDHSSYSELHAFVKRVQPKKILPIVSSRARGAFGTSVAERANMECFKKYLNPDPVTEFAVPPSVQHFMSVRSFHVSSKAAVASRRVRKHYRFRSRPRLSAPKKFIFSDSPLKSSTESNHHAGAGEASVRTPMNVTQAESNSVQANAPSTSNNHSNSNNDGSGGVGNGQNAKGLTPCYASPLSSPAAPTELFSVIPEVCYGNHGNRTCPLIHFKERPLFSIRPSIDGSRL